MIHLTRRSIQIQVLRNPQEVAPAKVTRRAVVTLATADIPVVVQAVVPAQAAVAVRVEAAAQAVREAVTAALVATSQLRGAARPVAVETVAELAEAAVKGPSRAALVLRKKKRECKPLHLLLQEPACALKGSWAH